MRLTPAWVFLFILPFTHTVALRLLSLFAAFAIAAWCWARERTPRLPGELPAWRWIALWALLPVALAPFSQLPGYSLGEAKTEVLYALLALLAFFVGVRDEAAFRRSLQVLLAAYAVLTVWALASRLTLGAWNEGGYFGGTGTFATYLVTVWPLIWLCAWLGLLGRQTMKLVPLLVVLGLIAGWYTEQRAFWLVVVLQAVALVALLRASGEWRRVPAAAWCAIAGIATIAFLGLADATAQRFGEASNLAALLADDPRLKNWSQVVAWIGERPLTGYGFGRGMMAKVFPEMWNRPDMFWHPHNVILGYGFQLGLLGVAALLGVFGAWLAHWLRSVRSQDPALRAIGIAGALIVLGVFTRNLTNDFFHRDLALLFWSLMGLLAAEALRRARAPA